MKKENYQYNIIRLKTSSYFKSNFLSLEKQNIENKFNGLKYFFEAIPKNQFPNIILSNTHVNYDELTIDLLKNTALIIHANSGWDNLPFSLSQYDMPIIVGNEIRKNAVSEYILSALFKHFSSIPFNKNWDKDRVWNKNLLFEKNILIMGYGHIGEIVFQALKPICKNLMIYDPFKGQDQLPNETIDVLIPLMSLNPISQNLIDHDFLKKLSPDAVIINAARGKLIKELDLIQFLKNNPNSFAYLDVFDREPNDFTQFENLNNIATSSHIAGVFNNIDNMTIEFETRVIEDFLVKEQKEFLKIYKKSNLKEKIHQDFFL